MPINAPESASTANQPSLGITPKTVLGFAKMVFATTQNRRAAQLAAGRITQAKFDADVLAAAELLRLAEDAVIFGDGIPLN